MPYHLNDFGADGNGVTNDAAALQRAIDTCYEAGGGTVLVPAGQVFMTGSFVLKARVELYLERGATLLASPNYADYTREHFSDAVTDGLFDETELPKRAWITSFRAHDAAITGGGTLDGNGRAFVAEDQTYIYKMRDNGDEPQYLARPYTLHLIGSVGLTIKDVIIKDGAFWTLRLTGCEDVVIHGVRIRNDLKLPNNDAIDLVNCRRVRVSDCDIVSGDDAICLKTNRATQVYGACEDITVTGCTLMSTSSALKLGNEICSPIRNVIFDACTVRSSHRGLCIHVGEPGDVENVIFSNMIVETRIFYEAWWGRGEPIYLNSTPWRKRDGSGRIRRVRIFNVLAKSENGVMIYAEKPGWIDDIVLENVRIELNKTSKWNGSRQDLRPRDEGDGMPELPTNGFTVHHAKNVTLRNCEVVWGENRPAYYGKAVAAEGAVGLELTGFKGEDAHVTHAEQGTE